MCVIQADHREETSLDPDGGWFMPSLLVGMLLILFDQPV